MLRQRRNLNCASCGVSLGFREDAGDEEDWDATSSDDTVKSEQQTSGSKAAKRPTNRLLS